MLNISGKKVFFLIVVLISFFACQKNDPYGCDEEPTLYYYLKTTIPYQLGQIIKYTDTLGNHLEFTCNLKKQSFNLGHHTATADCGFVPDYSESVDYSFTEKNNLISLSIWNSANTKSSYSGDLMQINLNKKYFWKTEYENYEYLPSVFLNGFEYKNLNLLTYNTSKVYYSESFGIVSFQNDSIQWFLTN